MKLVGTVLNSAEPVEHVQELPGQGEKSPYGPSCLVNWWISLCGPSSLVYPFFEALNHWTCEKKALQASNQLSRDLDRLF
jgi:hypothetical protein